MSLVSGIVVVCVCVSKVSCIDVKYDVYVDEWIRECNRGRSEGGSAAHGGGQISDGVSGSCAC